MVEDEYLYSGERPRIDTMRVILIRRSSSDEEDIVEVEEPIENQDSTDEIDIEIVSVESDEFLDVENDNSSHIESNVAQEPNLIPPEESTEAGIENPIVRLENPHYSPEKKEDSDSLKRTHDVMEEEEINENCPVCLEPWTTGGPHRLCCLKCGHLFGRSCVLRWLLTSKRAACPQCNAKARKSDVRNLYATKLVSMDTNELDNLREEHNRVIEENRELKKKLDHQVMMASYYQVLAEDRAGTSGSSSKSSVITVQMKFRTLRTLNLEENSGRVLAYNSERDLIVASQKSTTCLFPGFGVNIFSAKDWTKLGFNIIHKKEMRDIAFNPTSSEQVLSVSFDNTAKVFDVVSRTELASFTADSALWSCCWDPHNIHKFYCGSARGEIHVFDLVSPEEVIKIENHDAALPVISLHASSMHHFVLCCRAHSVTAYIKQTGLTFRKQVLQISQGTYSAMCYDDARGIMVVTCRPNVEHVNVRHICYKITFADDVVTCVESHVFLSGQAMTRMSRPCILSTSSRSLYFSFNESQSAIWGWCLQTKSKIISISVNRPVMDMLAIDRSDDIMLLILSTNFIRCCSLT